MTRSQKLAYTALVLVVVVVSAAWFTSYYNQNAVVFGNYLGLGSFFSQPGSSSPSDETLLDNLADSAVAPSNGQSNQVTERGPVALTEITPSSGSLNVPVTLVGSGLHGTGYSVNFAGVNKAITNLTANNGRLSFTIPATPCASGTVCAQTVLSPGEYNVSLTNAQGQTSNELTYTVTETPL